MSRPLSFIPGIELSRRFYFEAVQPLLDEHFPGLPHAAARIGSGSEVLGFDTEMSMDHGWFPQVQIFLRQVDEGLAEQIREMLRMRLPHRFLGFPVDTVPLAEEPGTILMQEKMEGPVEHAVRPVTLQAFVLQMLAWDPGAPLEAADWLTIPSQALRALTSGAVYEDIPGELTDLRARLAWYPQPVWLYLLAAGWQRIGQEEHLMPRAGLVGDELGSALIGSRLVRDIMSLCFLMEKQYAPYPKWFGSAFRQLECAAELAPLLWSAQTAGDWQGRAAALGQACEILAHRHNRSGLTVPLPERLEPFHGRPFMVIQAGRFSQALLEGIDDPAVQSIAARGLIGSLDQISDNTDLRSHPSWRTRLRHLYAGPE